MIQAAAGQASAHREGIADMVAALVGDADAGHRADIYAVFQAVADTQFPGQPGELGDEGVVLAAVHIDAVRR
ncbi:hypothetical protein D9M69_461640 [compost metagenome]